MEWIDQLLPWYRAAHRDLPWRKTRDPYHIWISEIMLQQTRVAAVIPYYQRFLGELPTVHDLAQVDDDRLMKLWQGLGYYSRAKNLKRAAQEIVAKFSGVVPNQYETLLTLPGIGSYTAAAIASIAFGEKVPAVDGNVLRVFSRVYADDRDILDARTKKAVFTELLSGMPDDAGAFNQAMMELGAVVCLPNGLPLCDACPVSAFCKAHANGTAACYPKKKTAKQRSVQDLTVFLLKKEDRFLIRKRPNHGLLAGLYELPNVPGRLSVAEALAVLSEHGLHASGSISAYDRRHIFTHVEWHMRVICVESVSEAPKGWLWYDGTQSIPTAFSICLS